MNSPIKYPLPCGCAGPKVISMCDAHQLEFIARQRRLMGIGVREEVAKQKALLSRCHLFIKDLERLTPEVVFDRMQFDAFMSALDTEREALLKEISIIIASKDA